MNKILCSAERLLFGWLLVVTVSQWSTGTLLSQVQNVPSLVNYQGRVIVGSTNFNGSGQFKFSLVDGLGTTSYWSNDGTSTGGSEPTAAVALPVTNGYYSVMLGDSTLANMIGLPANVFSNPDVRLRVWFNDGTHGFQMFSPDQRIGAAPYAVAAATGVPNGIKEFRTAGTHVFTVPAGIARIQVQAWGAGGGGGAAVTGTNGEAGGGGGGAYVRKIIPVTPSSDLAIVVGAGGEGNNSGRGGDGGDSIVNDAQNNALFAASGGKGGGPAEGGAGGAIDETASISRPGSAGQWYRWDSDFHPHWGWGGSPALYPPYGDLAGEGGAGYINVSSPPLVLSPGGANGSSGYILIEW